jgi:hypothetical protein
MPEFKIEGDALRRETRFRVLSWGTILLLLAATVLLFALGISGNLGAGSNLRSLFVVTLLATVIGTCVLACREALHYAERQMVFVLNSNEIVRKRRGYPDVGIALSDIETLSEELGWLIIRGADPRKKIAIPSSVSGYEVIRGELAKRHALSAHAGFPVKRAALLTASLLSWAAVLLFRDESVVILAGAIGLITLALGSGRLWALLHRSSKRLLLWASLGFAWLAALLLIYLRLARS